MFFASDNWAGAHPAINERLLHESTRFASAYGTSDLDRAIEARFNEIFEREVAVFFVATGTAANSLALASVARPGGTGAAGVVTVDSVVVLMPVPPWPSRAPARARRYVLP